MHTTLPAASDSGLDPGAVGFRPAPPPPHAEADLGHYVRALARHRMLLLAAGLVSAIVAGVVGFLSDTMYETEATLVVSRPKITEAATDTTTVANFIPFVVASNVAAQVIKELQLDVPPYGATPSLFFSDFVRVEEVRNSTIVRVKGRLRDPQVAARMVNRVAEIGSDAARRASQQEAVQARDDIKMQLEESSNRLTQAEQTLQKYRERSQVEVLKKDVEAALKEREGLLKLQLDIEAEKSKLAKAETELSARDKVDTLKRSIDSEPLLLEAARKPANGQPPPPDVLGLQLRSEQSNPVYQALDRVVATSRANLAALERRKQQLTARKLDGPANADLSKLYEAEGQIAHLEMERDLSKKVYQEVATSYETARLMVAGRSSALQLIAPATVPERPVSKHIGRNMAIGFVAGLLIAALGVLLLAGATSPAGRPAY